MVAWSYLYLHLRAGNISFIRLALDIRGILPKWSRSQFAGPQVFFQQLWPHNLLLSFPPSNAYLRVQLNHSDYSDIFFFWSAPLSLSLNNGNKNNKNLWKTFFMSVWSDSLYQAAKQAGCGFLCDQELSISSNPGFNRIKEKG